jgi:hypothetical protein
LILFTYPLIWIPPFAWLNKWLRKQLLWNFVLRLLFEESLETTFCLILQYRYGSGFTPELIGTAIDFVFAIVLGVAIVYLPYWMAEHYLLNYHKWSTSRKYRKWKDEEFEETYGAPMEGLRRNSKWVVIFPVYFIIRRIAFACVALFMFNYVVFQLFLAFYLTFLSFVYLVHVRPYEVELEGTLDIWNEVTTIIAIDICYMFTEDVENAELQYKIGYVYIVVVLGFIAV